MTDANTLWYRLHGLTLGDYTLQLAQYSYNNRYSLQAYISKTHEPECSVTVNLDNENIEDDEFFVRFETRKYSPDVFQALIDAQIAEPTGRVVSAGYVERYAEVWKLLPLPSPNPNIERTPEDVRQTTEFLRKQREKNK